MRTSVAALALATMLPVTAGACSGGGDEPGRAASSPARSTAPPATGPSTPVPSSSPTASPSGATAGSSSAASSPRPTPAAVLADGRHPARIVGIDTARDVISIDVVQFFTGAAASAAAEEDGAAEVPPPNDVWIRNENPLVRTLPVARDAAVVTNTLTAAETGSSTRDVQVSLHRLAQLPHVRQALFWVTVRDGTVTSLHEQYLP